LPLLCSGFSKVPGVVMRKLSANQQADCLMNGRARTNDVWVISSLPFTL